jgi:hypothetical protein
MHGTKKDGSSPQASHNVKDRLPLSMFHQIRGASPPRQHPKSSQLLLIGHPLSPSFAIIRPFSSPLFVALFRHPISSPYFIALFRTFPLFVALWFRILCRQTITSMPSANQLPVTAIVTPGKVDFFFNENAGMPPAGWVALMKVRLARLPALL